MGYTAKQLVAIAEAEIGYHEKARTENQDRSCQNRNHSGIADGLGCNEQGAEGKAAERRGHRKAV